MVVNPVFHPPGAGSGPVMPLKLALTAPGSTSIASLTQIPAGANVVVEMWGAGGGGGGYAGSPSNGGGGGGGGSYLMIRVPAAVWALGGALVVPAGGTAGVAAGDGGNGSPATCTINSILRGSAGGGVKGLGNGSGGAAGAVSVGAGVTELARSTGEAGTAHAASNGGGGGDGGGPGAGRGAPGGTSSTPPAAGGAPSAGGGGGHYNDGNGSAGARGQIVLSW